MCTIFGANCWIIFWSEIVIAIISRISEHVFSVISFGMFFVLFECVLGSSAEFWMRFSVNVLFAFCMFFL